MHRILKSFLVGLLLAGLALSAGTASAVTCPGTRDLATGLCVDPGTGLLIPDYFGSTANWGYTPPLRKFVDTLPPLGCGTIPSPTKNNLNQCIPVAVPNTTTFIDTDGTGPIEAADYYEIEIGEFKQKMHSDMPATTLRGYRQVNVAGYPQPYQYLGPLIIAQKNRPVRIKFINSLPAGSKLFIPVDTTVMGAGMGAKTDAGAYCDSTAPGATCAKYSENRATLHLHGGLSPWISDGTPHQWITPALESTPYRKGDSVQNVPDMWFTAGGALIPSCAGSLACGVAGATNDPGPGAQTFYWTNQQSARLMFFHDHSWGITRLNVYVGEAAGYMIQDSTELDLIARGKIPADQIPLIIQDKSFVDAATIGTTDPTWAWGTSPGLPAAIPNTGDLWWPHIYVPAQNPYDAGGANPTGRWHYGYWFWPPTTNIPYPPIANPYYDPDNAPWEPPLMPATPLPSWGAEAFMDTPVVNGTAYPVLSVDPKAYRFRILNAAHDRFFNLQFYEADSAVPVPADCPTCVGKTEVRMVPAVATAGFPDTWPTDGRPGGVPDPATAGPSWIQIGTEGGFLPAPAVLLNTPVNWNTDVTTFTAGNVNQGTLILGPAERADVIIDFSAYAGKTLILYNDAPAPFPALDPHYDYYTGVEDLTEIGGSPGTPVGRGPNTRTIMQIKVAAVPVAAAFDLGALEAEFVPAAPAEGVFKRSQNPVIVGQSAYDAIYNMTFPATYPEWGLARIGDNFLSFRTADNLPVTKHYLEAKAIQDEMGEVFDEYGRMSAKLGLELPKTVAGIQTFMLQNYVDPSTEVVLDGEPQIWKITHNGVDTHPVHFHLFDVQLINRVGWDGFITLPDANELGWKDTIRISPLMDTIVALRPKAPVLPFPLPGSNRVLNPSLPEDDGVNAIFDPTMSFTQIDPVTGLPRLLTNTMTNFYNEYVWHCHILSHEEADMMRTIVLREATVAPADPIEFSATPSTQRNTLKWTDTQFRPILPDLTAPDFDRATGFRVERRCDTGCTTPNTFTTIATITTFSTSPDPGPGPGTGEPTYKFQGFTDTLLEWGGAYSYRVIAFNSVGDSVNYTPILSPSVLLWENATGVNIVTDFPSPHAVPVKFTATATYPLTPANPLPAIEEYRFWLDGIVVQDYSAAKSWSLPVGTAIGVHAIVVDVRTDLTSATPDASASVNYEVIEAPAAPTALFAVAGNGQATVTFTAPANGGSPITSYTATANPGGQTGTSGTTSITVFGLTNGTAYTFTVTATNAAGTGPASLPSNSVTPSLVAGVPQTEIVWQESTAGWLYVWHMSGANRIGAEYLSPNQVATNWKIAAIADFDGDGKDDILWRESTAGWLYLWYMNGVQQIGGAYLNPSQVALNWNLAGVADFDGDGKKDILWQESIAGWLYVWYMGGAGGTTRISNTLLNPSQITSNWKVAGIADFDGDGKPDILWRETAGGWLYLWYMGGANGANFLSGTYLNPSQIATSWSVSAVRDFDGNGRPDLLWRDTAGYLYLWFMGSVNGADRLSGQYLSPNQVAPIWKVGGAGNLY